MKDDTAAFIETTVSANSSEIILYPDDIMDMARQLIARDFTRENLRTLHRHRGTFWLWTGSYYRQVSDEAVRAEIWKFLSKAKVDKLAKNKKPTLAPFMPRPENVNAVADALRALCRLDDVIEPPAWLTESRVRPEALLACGNGLLHVPSGKLLKPTPAYFGLSASKVNFNPKARKPKKWLKFLDEVVVDKESIRTLQDMFGYVLTPNTSQQKIFMLYGQPRSGRGTTARVLTELLGHDSVASPTMSSLSGQFGLQSLIPSLVALIPDARLSGKSDKAAIAENLLTISGEDSRNIQRKHLPDWIGRLRTRFIILTNELLAIADAAGALAKRLITVVFPNSFLGHENPKLTQELLAELEGILNWAIEGYRRLNKRGHFIQPKNSKDLVEKIEDLGAPVKAFVRECCVVSPTASVSIDALFQAYRSWCESKQQRASNEKWFGRELRSAVPGLGEKRPRIKGTPKEKDLREHLYIGLRLKNKNIEMESM